MSVNEEQTQRGCEFYLSFQFLSRTRKLTHPHDPYEEDGVADEEEADGEVVEQGLRKPRLEEERASELGESLCPGLKLLANTF